MYGCRPMVVLTVQECRVLMSPPLCDALFGDHAPDGATDDATLLVDALAGPAGDRAHWLELLDGLTVPLLDVNSARTDALVRIPGLSAGQASTLARARPYLSLRDLIEGGDDLAEVARIGDAFLVHEGYVFWDKPQGKVVDLRPDPGKIVVRAVEVQVLFDLGQALPQSGLVQETALPDERLLLCRWEANPSERPSRLRTLKQDDRVETVAPVLLDAESMARVPVPDRLDLQAEPDLPHAAWDRLLAKHGLVEVESYGSRYGSMRVGGHPHDLGALYRTLRALSSEVAVRFAEPTYAPL